MTKSLWSLIFLFSIAAVCVWAADASHGAMVLEQQNCLECHTVRGAGTGEDNYNARSHYPAALDLGENLTSTYTAPGLASLLWNHTPAMWREMSAQAVARPTAAESDWQDVFMYLYSLQHSENPSSGLRGREIFTAEQCGECHAATGPQRGAGPPVETWAPLNDPVSLVYQMWSHAASMQNRFAARRKNWRNLTGQDFMDLTAYLQTAQKLPRASSLSLPDPASGEMAFNDNCRSCHFGPMNLARRLTGKTWMDIGAGMWNHVPLMKPLANVRENDMRKILAYVWELQYSGPDGIVARGRGTFEEKGCLSCHRTPGGRAAMSPVPGKALTAFSMVALGWPAGPKMYQEMKAKGIAWPRMTAEEIADVTAYLNYIGSHDVELGR